MGEEFEIRRYAPSDADRVLTVYELTLEAHGWEFGEEFPPDVDITNSFLGITDNYLDMGGDFLVGIKNDEIIATGGIQPKDGATAEIQRMAVRPDHQRHGYGERILVELEDRAESHEFSRLVLETFGRLTAAQSLYEKHGYEEMRREPDETFGDTRIYYHKEL